MATSLIERVHAYEEAHNQHDIQAVMAMCTDDIRFEIVGVWIKVGKDSVRLLEEWDSAVNGSLRFRDLQVVGEEITCRATERNDWFGLVGIDEVEYSSCRFRFRGGLLAEIRSEMMVQSMEVLRAALGSVIGWASQERGEILARLMPEGEFVYGEESARGWLALLREWQQSQRG